MYQPFFQASQLTSQSSPKLESTIILDGSNCLLPIFTHPLLKMQPLNMADQQLIKNQLKDQLHHQCQYIEGVQYFWINRRTKQLLTKEQIYQVNKAFRELTQQKCSPAYYSKTILSLSMKLGVCTATLSKRFADYKVKSFITYGKILNHQVSPQKNMYLLKSLLQLSLNQRVRFHQVSILSSFIKHKYGIEYSQKQLSKQIEKMNVNLAYLYLNLPLFSPIVQPTAKNLMRQLVSMKAIIVYFAKYQFKYNQQTIMIMVIASRFGICVETSLANNSFDLIKQMIFKYTNNFNHQLWYLIASYEDFIQRTDSKIGMKMQESTFCSELASVNPRIVFLNPSSDRLNCAEMVYRKIIVQLFQSKIDVSQGIKGIPIWLKRQESAICSKIGKLEDDLL